MSEQHEFHERHMIEQLLGLDSGLSDWELSFIEDMDRLLGQGIALTLKQIEKINEIHEDRVD